MSQTVHCWTQIRAVHFLMALQTWEVHCANTNIFTHPSVKSNSDVTPTRRNKTRLASNGGVVDCVWNVMAHAQKRNFVSRRNGRVHLNRRGASVQSATGSRGVRICGSNAGYTMFRGSVKSKGYPLHSPVFPSLPLPCVTACHHISAGVCIVMFSWYTEVHGRHVIINLFVLYLLLRQIETNKNRFILGGTTC
jgi:hypothetical protein